MISLRTSNLAQSEIGRVAAYRLVEVMTMAQIGTLDRIVDDATRTCSGEPESMQDYLMALLEMLPEESGRKPSLWRDDMRRKRRAVRGRWE